MSNAASRVAQAYSMMHLRRTTGVPERIIQDRLYLFIEMDDDEANLWAAVGAIEQQIASIQERIRVERLEAWGLAYAEERAKLAKAAKMDQRLRKKEELKIKTSTRIKCEGIFNETQWEMERKTDPLYNRITRLKDKYTQRYAH